MRRLRLSSQAEREINELYVFGAKHYGLGRASDYALGLRQKIGSLPQAPFIHAERTDVRPPVRLLQFRAHNVLYTVSADEVFIVRVLHHSANWIDLL